MVTNDRGPREKLNSRIALGDMGHWLRELFDLHKGLDREGTIITIKNNKRMRGANAWLLICSIMIASLGLDLNSPAIIIGAMLISPLMSPILGVGLSVAINDREALGISLQHFGISILIALATSTIYFSVTPLGEITTEILGRTEPTLLDGLVAIFGGLAGIISTTRKDKTSAIPGVAIATALMPPLCVTGFGIANQQWDFILNSFYLFFLNSFFIAITAYLIIRLLNFPLKSYENRQEARRNRIILIVFSLLITIPSLKILMRLYDERQDDKKIEQFIAENFGAYNGARCIDYELIKGDTSRELVLELLGSNVPDSSMPTYKRQLEQLGLPDVNLTLIQDLDLGIEQINKLQLELNNLGRIAQNLESVKQVKTSQDLEIDRLRLQLDSLHHRYNIQDQVFQEAKAVFPDLKSLAFANAQKTTFDTTSYRIPLFILSWDQRKTNAARRSDEKKIYDFLKIRAQLDTLQLVVGR